MLPFEGALSDPPLLPPLFHSSLSSLVLRAAMLFLELWEEGGRFQEGGEKEHEGRGGGEG